MAGFSGLGSPMARNPLASENSLEEDRVRAMAEFDLQSELQLVFDAANRSNTAIRRRPARAVEQGVRHQDNIGMRQSQQALRSTINSLQVLAENTDGRAIVKP